MKDWKVITKSLARQYWRATKKEKGVLLNYLLEATGYNRCYAAGLLRNHDREVVRRGQTIWVADIHKKVRLSRERMYDESVKKVLISIWEAMDYPCGKRLTAALLPVVDNLARHGRLQIDFAVRGKLCRMSAATIDRLLEGERKKYVLKGRSHTKPGTLLKHQVPIRTFSDWNEKRPGFVEVDLVGHDGGNASGEFGYTLDVTDVCTLWTETEAVQNKAQVWVFEAMKRIRARLPFDLCGIDSDNGSEFINAHFIRYCEAEGITFTRGRAYKKNDGCFVEQKNYSVVRRAVGYARYDTEEEIDLLNALYRFLRLYTNFFQPSMKLMEKIRSGARVTKRYDVPKTPYQRVLEAKEVPEERKKALKKVYSTLDLVQLKREIERLQGALERSVSAKRGAKRLKEGVFACALG